MLKGFEILTATNTHNDILKYREQGAIRGVYLGFPLFHENYTMSLPGCTDWTGFPACFTKEQLIITDKGNVEISKIKIGDRVLCYNHELKINEYRFVTNTLIHKTEDKIYKIKMKDGTIIKVTENHLFWTGTSYVKIKELLLSLKKKKLWKHSKKYQITAYTKLQL